MPKIELTDKAQWRASRAKNIGGSDVSSLFYRWHAPDKTQPVTNLYEAPPEGAVILESVSPYKTGYRLWKEKSGALLEPTLDEKEWVQAGIFLEPAIAAWSSSKWGWPITKCEDYYTHETVAGWGASLDFVAANGEPVEIKNVDGMVFRDKWSVDGDEVVSAPLNYILQLQHQMGAVGAKAGWLVVCAGGNKLYRGRFERHEPTQAKIAAAIDRFWLGVRGNENPSHVADYETVADIYRNAAGARTKSPLVLELSGNEAAAIVADYVALKEADKARALQLDIAKGRLAEIVGDFTRAKIGDVTITWPVIDREEKLVPAKISKALTYRGAMTVKGL